ncbi:MAG TPA: dienelactone hydrolase family protein [Propionibacteriaceae bacterium]|nr:dienelactone hydrolase family protein [Propionibacteriaceae bacterium]
MTDVSIAAPAGGLPAYVARPSGPGPFPGVVVVHDAFGLGNEIRAQADWLADAGYLAVAPDLFRGRSKVACMVTIMRDARDRTGPTFDDLEAARQWVATSPDCTGTVGVIGFCLGGGLALLLAPDRGFSAASVNYGAASKEAYTAGFLRTACPIVGSYGAKDRTLRGAAARLESALTEVGVDHDVKEYPQAGHAFLNDRVGAGDRVPALFAVTGRFMHMGYQPDAAADARGRILAFFDRHLRDASPASPPDCRHPAASLRDVCSAENARRPTGNVRPELRECASWPST